MNDTAPTDVKPLIANLEPPKPTIGRIVHYFAFAEAPPQAAIVANVYEDTPDGGGAPFKMLALTVFGHDGSPIPIAGIPFEGDVYPRAVWPPRS